MYIDNAAAYIQILVHMYIYICGCTHVYIYICRYIHVHIQRYICINVCELNIRLALVTYAHSQSRTCVRRGELWAQVTSMNRVFCFYEYIHIYIYTCMCNEILILCCCVSLNLHTSDETSTLYDFLSPNMSKLLIFHCSYHHCLDAAS